MKKKMISLLLVAALVVGINSFAFAFGSIEESKVEDDIELDPLDIVISASYVLNSSDETTNFINQSTAMQTLPLYNADGSIVAYYATFTGGGYAVINNNIENPAVIEFGAGRQPMIEEILVAHTTPQIIYCSPVAVYETAEDIQGTRTTQFKGLHENYPELLEKNEALASKHQEQRRVLKDILTYATQPLDLNDQYGFISWSAMPSGAYTADNIPFYNTKWATTGDYQDIDENCCGAVAATNLAFYFADAGYSKLRKSTDRETFIAVQKCVGKGPALNIQGESKKYFSDCGYKLNYGPVSTMNDFKSAIKNDRPCSLLLADHPLSWHWILGVGYRTYNISGDSYIRIVNGWQNDANRFYMVNKGSWCPTFDQYWIGGTT